MRGFETLIDQIYEASVFPEQWSSTLHDLGAASGCAGGIILLRRSDNWIGWRASEGLRGAKEFMNSDAPARSGTTARLLGIDRAGFVTNRDLYSDEEYRRDSLVAEWAEPNGLFHSAATAIKTPSSDMVVVHVQRKIGADPFGASDVAFLDAVRPHLARAGLLAVRLQFERFKAAARALELVGLPALILDRSGRTLCANDLVRDVGKHIGWKSGDKAVLLDAAANERLKQALHSYRENATPISSSFVSTPGRKIGKAIIHLIPVASSARDLFEGGVYFLIVTAVGQSPAIRASMLEGLFDLTPAEAQVARFVGMGWPLERIAQERGCSTDTIRSQLKAIFSKTDTGRQSELASLLSSVPGLKI